MAKALDTSALRRWRRQPTSFIKQVLRDPETGKPFQLLPCEYSAVRPPKATP
jgi:hypothetical protein